MRISDWSSDVCSSDLAVGDAAAAADRLRDAGDLAVRRGFARHLRGGRGGRADDRAGRPAAGGAAGAYRGALRTGADGVSAPLLDIDGIEVGYPAPGGLQVVVDALSLALDEGAIGCLLGASGCGKTTVLRAVAGFEPVQAGRIEAQGRRVAASGFSIERKRVVWGTSVSVAVYRRGVRNRKKQKIQYK